eukprot:CAMPEP_0115520788 /NCGR_PEP_ID=MMETSP0271-20121206/79183_1 /TAXON_ID=71861 /ORGANISM="Scrippsiella trochoidea, Strain CCMP3099" /LENGTH=74 /DNA_ID=CAMNT_0002951943 /DNA_START=93 /DNA_END=317 /DNA_ORIENTATION=-
MSSCEWNVWYSRLMKLLMLCIMNACSESGEIDLDVDISDAAAVEFLSSMLVMLLASDVVRSRDRPRLAMATRRL